MDVGSSSSNRTKSYGVSKRYPCCVIGQLVVFRFWSVGIGFHIGFYVGWRQAGVDGQSSANQAVRLFDVTN